MWLIIIHNTDDNQPCNGRLSDGRGIQSPRARSEDQRETLRLFFFDGYTLAEIAAKLGQTTGNVSHHYYHGLEKLRRRLFGGKLQGK